MTEPTIQPISPDIVIMTRDELRQITDAAFQRGVQRGMFEEKSRRNAVPKSGALGGHCDSGGSW